MEAFNLALALPCALANPLLSPLFIKVAATDGGPFLCAERCLNDITSEFVYNFVDGYQAFMSFDQGVMPLTPLLSPS